mmetsp:Transcript_133652/g.236574  ORF Transcript_133652/g.236574 Transcript_133652/m.236574 type:complete len:227 (+) Transcript_133652:71-751(+)
MLPALAVRPARRCAASLLATCKTSTAHCWPSGTGHGAGMERLLERRCSFAWFDMALPCTISLPLTHRVPQDALREISLPGVSNAPHVAPQTGGASSLSLPGLPTHAELPGAEDKAPLVDAPAAVVPLDEPTGEMSHGHAPMECLNYRRPRKSQGLLERWWLEYDPPKANYISGKGRGPHGGHSIRKKDWPRQMMPINYKKNWRQREKMRFAFRKHGFEFDVPSWGG